MLWYFSRDSPPQDLKQGGTHIPISSMQGDKGRETVTLRKGEMKTREREGEWEKERRRDKVRDVDRNDENVRVLACFRQQEGSKTRGRSTIRDGRRESREVESKELVTEVRKKARTRQRCRK